MANDDFPILNGIAPSWADISVKTQGAGLPLIDHKDIKSCTRTRTVEEGVQRAPGGRIMRRTTGQPSQEFAWVLYRTGYEIFYATLAEIAPVRGNVAKVSLVFFDIQVMHTPPGSDQIFQYRVKGARVIGDTMAHAEGVEADTVEVPLSTVEVVDVINGREVALL